MKPKSHILATIILTQFACTSTWFAGNAIMESLIKTIDVPVGTMGWVLSSVQLGFIVGTLTFGLLMIADRYAPAKVFMICALLAAASNFVLALPNLNAFTLLMSRFATGFFLAGIYPVGMKIAADYYEKGLGKALGFLVGALVLGTAFPYLVNGTDWGQQAETVVQITSLITILGGLLLYLCVPNGPYRVASKKIRLEAGPQLFKNINFRKAALGYVGHMWELYAFWAFTPFAIAWYNLQWTSTISVPIWTGIIIALGGLSCALGGILSEWIGSKTVASASLILSGSCCLLSPLFFTLSVPLFLTGWCIWGIAVTADSPQLSKLIAGAVTPELKGTALTFATCIGFGITIVSIQLMGILQSIIVTDFLFLLLAIGPLVGVWHLIRLKTD